MIRSMMPLRVMHFFLSGIFGKGYDVDEVIAAVPEDQGNYSTLFSNFTCHCACLHVNKHIQNKCKKKEYAAIPIACIAK